MSNSERTIAVRANCDYAYRSLPLWAVIGLVEKIVTSLSRDSHVTKTSTSNSERTIPVSAHCNYAYGRLSLWALTGLAEKFM